MTARGEGGGGSGKGEGEVGRGRGRGEVLISGCMYWPYVWSLFPTLSEL